MNIHEYQAKNLLQKYGIAVPAFAVASNEEEVLQAIKELGLNEAVIKVQIHAGGRGKAGGVKFAKNPEEIVRLASELIGMKIVNNQTGSQGVVAHKVLIAAPVAIKKEYYLAAAIDRAHAVPIIIASPEGGMEIEEIAHKTPEKILKLPIGFDGKVRRYHLLELAKFMGWEGDLFKQGAALVANLAKVFTDTDADLLEINPLCLTEEGQLTAVDAKLSIDDNALYRQPAIAQWYDPSQSTQNEVMAKEYDLAYIGLEGEIGCLVNGAGLAMATMDIIHHYGGNPANFLDVGGGATKEEVAHGFKIILLDPRVKSIFVNIFGGIMDCGVLAHGIVAASQELEGGLSVPLVVRMEGTNVDIGKKILEESGLNIITAGTMDEGAIQAVKAAKGE
ncbi:MAG: Succinate--CoA ligase [ADP-forming] subunit beta [Chlamydiales bacterium]|nr:Succinate--CoA ligase [ADP-forming] subunit beta [Chlamydiales bacterium]